MRGTELLCWGTGVSEHLLLLGLALASPRPGRFPSAPPPGSGLPPQLAPACVPPPTCCGCGCGRTNPANSTRVRWARAGGYLPKIREASLTLPEKPGKSTWLCLHENLEGLGSFKWHLIQGVGGSRLLVTGGTVVLVRKSPGEPELSVLAGTHPRSPAWGCWGEGAPICRGSRWHERSGAGRRLPGAGLAQSYCVSPLGGGHEG